MCCAAVAATVLLRRGVAVAKDQAEAPKEKKICQVRRRCNSRIADRRICQTKAEWDAAPRRPSATPSAVGVTAD